MTSDAESRTCHYCRSGPMGPGCFLECSEGGETRVGTAAWLHEKATSYKEDARKMAELDASGTPQSGEVNWKQLVIVYRTIAQELEECARNCSMLPGFTPDAEDSDWYDWLPADPEAADS